MKKIIKLYTKIGLGIIVLLTCINIYLYNNFPVNGQFMPSEVLAIVFTNILLFGIFSVILHKIIDLLFDDDKVNYPTLADGASCECTDIDNIRPVFRRLPKCLNSLFTRHFVIRDDEISNNHVDGSSTFSFSRYLYFTSQKLIRTSILYLIYYYITIATLFYDAFISPLSQGDFPLSKLKLFAFITTLSCTSLIFWTGTCKDHILSVLTAILIVYYLLKYEKNKSMISISIALFLTGLLTWIRIELGIGMTIGILLYILLFHYKNTLYNKWVLFISFITGTIPLWINNYITTGSPFIHPFMISNAQLYMKLSTEDNTTAALIVSSATNPLWTLFHTLFSPLSGAVALLVIIPLITIVLPAYILKRTTLSQTDILLFIIAFSSSLYYFIFSARFMHADMGIMPDMRYFIFFYTVITLFIISILSKIIPDLKYKRIIIYYILVTAYSATVSSGGTYRDLNKIINTLATIVMGTGIIAVINDIRLNKHYLTYILPIMIAIPMAWQLVMLFIYHTSKAHVYPMFIPITEFLYNYVFGLIL
jgi:hypothetical protein